MAVAATLAAVAFFLNAGAACAQTLGQGPDDDIPLWRVGVVLVLCLLLAVVAIFALRTRLGRGSFTNLVMRKDRRLQLVESLRLGSHADLCIVRCDGQDLLIVVSAQESKLLQTLPPRAPSDGERSP
jgi:flagellar biogenesis protein FliO